MKKPPFTIQEKVTTLWGFEYEFLVDMLGEIVPAFVALPSNLLDGNPCVGEFRTTPCFDPSSGILDILEFQDNSRLLFKPGFSISKAASVADKSTWHDYTNSQFKTLNRPETRSIYNVTPPAFQEGKITASLQVNFSFTRQVSITNSRSGRKSEVGKYPILFDFATVMKKLDDEFRGEIIESKRPFGVYRIKHVGGYTVYEYRSLPNSVDLNKLAGVLSEIKLKEL